MGSHPHRWSENPLARVWATQRWRRAHTALFSTVVVASVMAAVANVYVAYWLGGAVATLGKAPQHWVSLVALLVGAATIGTLSRVGAGLCSIALTNDLMRGLQESVSRSVWWGRLEGAAHEWGEVSARLNTDIPSFVGGCLGLVTSTLAAAVSVVALYTLGWTLSPRLTLLLLLGAPVYAVIAWALRAPVTRATERTRTRWADAVTQALSLTTGHERWKLEDPAAQTWLDTLWPWAGVVRAQASQQRWGSATGWLTSLVKTLMLMGIVVAAVLRSDGTPAAIAGALVTFLLFNERLVPSITTLTQVPVSASIIRLSATRLLPYLTATPYHLPVADGAHRGGACVVSRLAGMHPGRPTPLWDAVSFVVPHDGVVTVTGPNGAGKTTLLQLLLGLMAVESGHVAWDRTLRQRIAYVEAAPRCFPGSLRDNLTLGGEGDDGRLLHALRSLGWTGPVNLDHDLAGGRALSTGERKRVALARVLLRAPRVLIVDELEGGLDRADLVANVLRDQVPLIIAATHHPDVWPDAALQVQIEQGVLSAVVSRPPLRGESR